MRAGGMMLLMGPAVAVGSPLSAQTTATPPATTAQQDFEAGEALDLKRDFAGAIAAWDRLEARTKPGSRSRGIALVRKSATLFALNRLAESVTAARAGLALLPAGDATLADDRWRAYFNIGRVAVDTMDYAGAAKVFADAEQANPAPGNRMASLLALAEVETFTDQAAAQATLDRIDALAKTEKFADDTRGKIARRHATLALNRGDFARARKDADRAVTLFGGLTEQTDLNDVSARSDVAIALLLAGNPDEARRYMAFTGAGRLPKGNFNTAAEMAPPDCGGEAGLKPNDVAVVEFSIGDDGRVISVAPVYAAGGPAVALEFARVVRDWSWPVESVKEIPSFYRYNARVEMRCSTAFARPSVGDALDAAFEGWIAGKGTPVPPAPTVPLAVAIVRQRAALAAATARDPNSLVTLAALYRVANSNVIPREERAALYARGLAIASANGAPPLARLAFDLSARTGAITDIRRGNGFAETLTPMVSQPPYAGDPQARAAIRLLLADGAAARNRKSSKNDAALMILKPIADDRELAKNDPLRVGALIRIASIEQRNGQLDAARAAFEASGLTANQCAIMDAPPKPVSMPGGEAFPMEAARWGFEGWTQVQYDIGADGRTTAQRTLLSYPPFIFSKAGTDFFGNAKFAKTYRPDGGVGCGATTQRVRFLLPG